MHYSLIVHVLTKQIVVLGHLVQKLFGKAVPEAVRLIENFAGYARGENALSPAFGDTFSYKEGWENIPVLRYEEEKDYEV